MTELSNINVLTPVLPEIMLALGAMLIVTAALAAAAIVARSGATTPARILISVDFPAPFSPISAWISPGATASVTLRNAGTPA